MRECRSRFQASTILISYAEELNLGGSHEKRSPYGRRRLQLLGDLLGIDSRILLVLWLVHNGKEQRRRTAVADSALGDQCECGIDNCVNNK